MTDSCSVDKGGGVQMVRAEERGRGVNIRRADRLQDTVQRERSKLCKLLENAWRKVANIIRL